MGSIHKLDTLTANSIAAGEVVERPASVIKELLENALDAAATKISVEIKNGGISYIKISDNGIGMDENDAELAFERHATSKLKIIKDLDRIATMGFRGEALASLAAVSKITMETRQIGSEEGFKIQIEGSKIITKGPCGCPEGTTFYIKDLFYNLPARFKFLKKDTIEAGYIHDIMSKIALSRPDVSFQLKSQDKELLRTPGNHDLLSTIYAIWGKKVAAAMIPLKFSYDPVEISGYITTPNENRNNRSKEVFLVNGRLVQSKTIQIALDEACKTWFMRGRFPTALLSLNLPMELIDVNVHPQKTEIRFWDNSQIFRAVYHAVKQAFGEGSGVVSSTIPTTPTAKSPAATNDLEQELKTIPAPNKSSETTSLLEKKAPEQIELPKLTINEPLKKSEIYFDRNLFKADSAGEAERVRQNFIDLKTKNSEVTTQEPEVKPTTSNNTLNNASMESSQSEQTNPLKSIKFLENSRIIGQLFKTYIVLEVQDELVLVDQHAAHEKVLFEQLIQRKKDSQQEKAPAQMLLIPETIKLSPLEKEILSQHQEKLHTFGFDFETFGPDSIILRSVPEATAQKTNALELFQSILTSILEEKHHSPELAIEVYKTMSCKAAVKANDELSLSEMELLIKDLQTLDNPYHCPHGRPILFRYPKKDLEKIFKRIV